MRKCRIKKNHYKYEYSYIILLNTQKYEYYFSTKKAMPIFDNYVFKVNTKLEIYYIYINLKIIYKW